MPTELYLLLILLLIFVVPMVLDVNVGVVAFVAAFGAATWLLDAGTAQIVAGFPTQMFILMVGVTLLLAIAQSNGTIDWVVNQLLRLSGGRLVLLPWVLFITAYLTSSLGPTAAPVLFVIGVGFLARFDINPLLIAVMIIHGAQAGAYSPIAPYGVVIQQLANDLGVVYSPVSVFVGVSVFHFVLAVLVFLLLGGMRLYGQRYATGEAFSASAGGNASPVQLLTLVGFVVFLVAVVGFGAHLGFTAMSVALLLMLVGDNQLRTAAVNQVAWPIVLVICGVLTYVNLIQAAGAIDWLAIRVSDIGSSHLVGLVLSYIVALVTGVASTIGTIGMLIPLSAPFVVSGELDGTGLITAMAISAAVSDVSPFSTWGALFLATAAAVVERNKMLRMQLVYTGAVVSVLPLIAWWLFVV